MKKYILMIKERDNKYKDFYRFYYKFFNNYFELQKHLQNFWFIEKNNYIIFEETDLTKDYSINDVKRSPR